MPVDQIAPERPFNQWGLDSLMGTELQYRIEADLGVGLPIVELLQEAPIAALAGRLLEQLTAPGLRPIQAQDTPPGTPYPLSYAQQSLWFMYQLAPESRTNILACAMRVLNELDLPALQRAVQYLVDRHAALRTIFASEHGKPVQRIQPDLPITVEQIDASAWEAGELQQRLSEAAYQPFTLAEGPLFRVRSYTRAPAEHYLVLALPHAIADFRSLVRIMHELGLCYTAALAGQPAQLAALPLAYADYVRWEAIALGGAEGVRLWTYWREQLANAPTTLNLPTDHPRPALQTYRGDSVSFTLNSTRTRQLKALAETQGATLYMTVLAAFQALLYHYTQQDDFLIGSPMAGRTRAEFAHLAGPFARPVVLRADVSGDPAFVALLERTRQTVRTQGWAQIALPYRPTPKNAPVRQFVARLAAPAPAGEDGGLSYILPASGPLIQSAGQTGQSAGESAGLAHQPVEPAAVASEAVASRQNDGPLLRRIALELADAERITQAIRAWKQPQARELREVIGPRNEVEEVVATIWCELLGVAQVSIDDDFFTLGGHSLLATQMLSRIRDAFGVELPLQVMFVDTFSVADVAHAITDGSGRNGSLPARQAGPGM